MSLKRKVFIFGSSLTAIAGFVISHCEIVSCPPTPLFSQNRPHHRITWLFSLPKKVEKQSRFMVHWRTKMRLLWHGRRICYNKNKEKGLGEAHRFT